MEKTELHPLTIKARKLRQDAGVKVVPKVGTIFEGKGGFAITWDGKIHCDDWERVAKHPIHELALTVHELVHDARQQRMNKWIWAWLYGVPLAPLLGLIPFLPIWAMAICGALVLSTTVGLSPFRFREELIAHVEEGRTYLAEGSHLDAVNNGIKFAKGMNSWIYLKAWIFEKHALGKYNRAVFGSKDL